MEEMIFPESPEAAKFVEVKGWVSRDGFFYGDNEEIARIVGATHSHCKKCGATIKKGYTLCESCKELNALEKFKNYEEIEWDGESAIYSESHDKYFFSEEDIYDDYDEIDCEELSFDEFIEKLQLVSCNPNYCWQIEPEEYYGDIAPLDDCYEDFLPKEIEDAFVKLNEVIRNCKVPISWSPSNKRIALKSLKNKETNGRF